MAKLADRYSSDDDSWHGDAPVVAAPDDDDRTQRPDDGDDEEHDGVDDARSSSFGDASREGHSRLCCSCTCCRP